LSGRAAPELGGRFVGILPKEINTAVLVEVVPEVEAAMLESKGFLSSIRAAAGNLRVVIAPMKGLR
jgi:hypothetical protein